MLKLKTITAHKSNFPNPLRFKKGEILSTGIKDTKYKGWIWVKTEDGNEGWAPIQYLKIAEGDKATAIHDYNAKELDTSMGEELFLHYELNEWGWVEKSDGSCGWVPMETTKIV